MANFQDSFDSIIKLAKKEIKKGESTAEINLEINVSSFAGGNFARDLWYGLQKYQFKGYKVRTCRIREIEEYLFVDYDYQDKDILIQLNLVLEKI